MIQILIKLAKYFGNSSLVTMIENESFYSECNDYSKTETCAERKFCTHCGKTNVRMIDLDVMNRLW